MYTYTYIYICMYMHMYIYVIPQWIKFIIFPHKIIYIFFINNNSNISIKIKPFFNIKITLNKNIMLLAILKYKFSILMQNYLFIQILK